MEKPEVPFGQRALEVMRPGPFRRYIVGSAISDTGTWMQVMAQAWVMSTLTDRAVVLGLVNFAAGLPTLALTMFGGTVADRYDKRIILIAAQAVQMILALIIGWLVLTGRIQIWHVLVLASVLGITIAFEMPALSAIVPELVKREEIATAVALDRSVFHGSRLIGPSLAGILVARWGAATAFFANAFTFIALIVAMLSIPPRVRGSKEEEEQRRSGMMEGVRFIRNEPTILALIGLIAATTIFVYPVVSVMLPLYVKNILQLGPDRLGFLMAVSGIGSLSGSIGLLSIARGKRLLFIKCAVGTVAAMVLAMSLSHSFAVTATAMGLLSVGMATNFGLANTIVQERAPSHLRGRISAVFGLSFFGLMPIAGLIVTSFSDLVGMRNALTAAAICYAAAAFLFLRKAKNTNPLEEMPAVEPEPAPAEAG
ncbi:MFS transporter [soil metagenome]